MARPDAGAEWTTCVSSRLPQLATAPARVLASWRYGIALPRAWGGGPWRPGERCGADRRWPAATSGSRKGGGTPRTRPGTSTARWT